ncbi:hypothetical protein CCMA1212_009669 [Trichoderma ghanense]|uniref:Uncharacterized protein n=1 Tax=Trichoderma ghanense TaxID=65468 RepID=A0ABY2GT22_9HYPO
MRSRGRVMRRKNEKRKKRQQRQRRNNNEDFWARCLGRTSLLRNAASKGWAEWTCKRAAESWGERFKPRVTWMRRAHMPAAASGSSSSGSGTLRPEGRRNRWGPDEDESSTSIMDEDEDSMRTTGEGLRDHAHHTHHAHALAHLVAARIEPGGTRQHLRPVRRLLQGIPCV